MEFLPEIDAKAIRVCFDVLRELEEELPISSEDEWHEVRALLLDFYGHGITGHHRLKGLLFSTIVNRRADAERRPTVRASYYSWGNGLMLRALAREISGGQGR
ncbi:hypothetical protein [Rhizobium sp. Rhizsp42]|uniref:hypothetical protein n=1 Tax=Rhizobium sp. Rhizsp42 TaxID=3243034 RepID=UPI0039B00C9D